MKNLLNAGEGTPIVGTHAEIIEGRLRAVMIDAWYEQSKLDGGKPDDALLTSRMASGIRDVVTTFANTRETRDAIGHMIAQGQARKFIGPQRILCGELETFMACLTHEPDGKSMGESFMANDRLRDGSRQLPSTQKQSIFGTGFVPGRIGCSANSLSV